MKYITLFFTLIICSLTLANENLQRRSSVTRKEAKNMKANERFFREAGISLPNSGPHIIIPKGGSKLVRGPPRGGKNVDFGYRKTKE